jgi:RND family efflux transporter MFP subunit
MTHDTARSTRSGVPAWIRHTLIPLLVLLAAGVLAWRVLRSAPRAERRPAERRAHLVHVIPARVIDEPVTVHAMGAVRAARAVDIQPRVSGWIASVSDAFEPGGRFAAGAVLVELDRADFALALRQSESALVSARGTADLESGRADVARQDFDLLGADLPEAERDLVLRRPQRRQAEAAVEAAEAAVAQARLNLDRTQVRAPFNAVIRARYADAGMSVSPATPLASLVGTDRFWIEAAVPVSDLRWIRFPDAEDADGPPVRVFHEAAWGAAACRTGQVVRLLADLEPQGRMARVLIAVDDPLGLRTPGTPALQLDAYVRVAIAGTIARNVVALDRADIHDDDTVWVMNAEDCLDIRHVGVTYRGPEQILVHAGIADGERIVTTALAAPVAGMPLRLPEDETPPEPAAP